MERDYGADLSPQERYKWIEYHKWKFASEWFTKIAGNLVLRTKAGFGFLGKYNQNVGDSPFERFYLGGSGLTGFQLDGREIIALRGYDDQSVSPRIGASLITKYTAELRYPFSLNPSATIYGLGFMEAGNTWNNFNDYNPFAVKRSVGLGIRVFLANVRTARFGLWLENGRHPRTHSSNSTRTAAFYNWRGPWRALNPSI